MQDFDMTCEFGTAPCSVLLQRVAVTNRVKVEAAAIFVPELSKQRAIKEEEEAYFFAYK